MSTEQLEQYALKYLDYKFSDIELLKLALTHKSAANTNNERLEFLGDSILNFKIGEQLFLKFSDVSEGVLTRMRAHLVCKKSLYQVALDINVADHILLGSSERRTGGHQRISILADSIEAIIGAVYVDGGIEKALTLVEHLYRKYLDTVSPEQQYKDAKTTLQEYLQSMSEDLPVYEVKEVSGPSHNQNFKVECLVKSRGISFIGTGGSRRKAEQEAANKVLEILKNE